jgi:hypothetical protein
MASLMCPSGSWHPVWMSETTVRNHAGFIWSVADLLRGDYKPSMATRHCQQFLPYEAICQKGQIARGSHPTQ